MLRNYVDAELEADIYYIIIYMAYYVMIYFALRYIMEHAHGKPQSHLSPSYDPKSLEIKEG
jgi:hypothetical protein